MHRLVHLYDALLTIELMNHTLIANRDSLDEAMSLLFSHERDGPQFLIFFHLLLALLLHALALLLLLQHLTESEVLGVLSGKLSHAVVSCTQFPNLAVFGALFELVATGNIAT